MSDRPDRLEELVSGLTRELPLRRAPASLSARVLAQVGLPWWRRGFAHWPLAARALFLVVSVGVAACAVKGAMYLIDAVSWLAAAVLESVSPLWLYGAAVAGGLSYVMLFGLGAVAYRTLNVQR